MQILARFKPLRRAFWDLAFSVALLCYGFGQNIPNPLAYT